MRGGAPLSSRRDRNEFDRGLLSPNTKFSVSIVIPAYNEESHLRACLESIARQTVRPAEVIVVDNNSTDATAAIARSFPFVTLLREKRQGPVYARDTGFNAARGEIIGRLDADSIIAANWVEMVQQVFEDKSVDATTGTVLYREVCLRSIFNSVDFWIRSFMARRAAPRGEQSMQGVNMAIRRSAWRAVRPHVCHERSHHEDLDLSAHLAQIKRKAIFTPSMIVDSTARRADSGPATFYNYAISTPRTYRLHGLKTHRYMYAITWFVIMLYVPIRIAYRSYNPATGRFSLRCLLWPEVTTGRVSPVAPTISLE
jgi:glycosyltransferase involved in cell wall biosynthesis